MKKRNASGERTTKPKRKQAPPVGQRIIDGLGEAIAWSRGEGDRVRVTVVTIPGIDVRQVRRRMGLSQTEFATTFCFPPATLSNWEQGRATPDARQVERSAFVVDAGQPAVHWQQPAAYCDKLSP